MTWSSRSSLSLGSAVACGVLILSRSVCADAPRKANEPSIDHWVQMALSGASEMEDGWSEVLVWERVAWFRILRADVDPPFHFTSQIQSPLLQHVLLQHIAISLARAGHAERAVEVAQSLQEDWLRHRALKTIAYVARQQHRCDVIEATIEAADSEELRRDLRKTLARAFASSGQWERALVTAEKLQDADDQQSREKAELRALILNMQRERRCERPRKPRTTVADYVRSFGTPHWTPPAKSALPKMEASVSELAAPLLRAHRLYQIALGWNAENDLSRCTEALKNAHVAARDISDPYDRMAYLVLVADLLLECGDRTNASQAVEEAVTEEALMRVIDEGDELGIQPRAVFVLVRLGCFQRAWEIATTAHCVWPVDAIWTFGAACALAGRSDEVEKRLAGAVSAEVKALLCIGVACGMLEAGQELSPIDIDKPPGAA